MGEIRPDDLGFSRMCESESEIAGSAAEIEDEGVGPLENGPQTLRGAGAPEAIELQGKKMVEQIVARGDLRKHFANFAGSIGFCGRPFGASSLHRRGGLNHGFLAKACYLP
jgi:hypothetical protein